MTSKEHFLKTWMTESKTTLTAFKTLPIDRLDYRPHPKTRSAIEIVEHLAPHTDDLIEALETGVVNHILSKKYSSIDEVCSNYTSNNSKIEQLIKTTDEQSWNEKIIPFNVMGKKVAEMPLRDICYMTLFDTVHHRGQLSTYYRPMGTRNPSIYGPTAEMIEEQMAAAKN